MGYSGGGGGYGNSFALIVVLFILLIIVGASFYGGTNFIGKNAIYSLAFFPPLNKINK